MEAQVSPRAGTGMDLVNVLFFLTIWLRIPLLTIVTYSLWTAVLLRQRKRSASRGLRLVYALLCVYAAAVIVLQLLSLITPNFSLLTPNS